MSETDVAQPGDDLRRAIATVRADHDTYLDRLAAEGGVTDGPRAANAPVVVADRSRSDETRLEVLHRMTATLGGRGGQLGVVLDIVADRDDSPAVRRTALDLLDAASFQVVMFAEYRARYEDLLRTLLDDPVDDLRRSAVVTLAQAHDRQTQDLLERGLRGEATLPVERARAVRLLAADDHHPGNQGWLEELYRDGDEEARLDAVRCLGSYPGAQDGLERALRDRDEAAAVRRQAAASLRHLAPERFDAVAKDIALDTSDYEEVRVACLTTLHHFGAERVHGDADFVARVEDLARGDGGVARAARGLVDRARR